MEARASFKDVLSSPPAASARVFSAAIDSQTARSSSELREQRRTDTGLSVLEMLPQGFAAIPPNNITLSVRLDDNNYLIWREQLMTVIMAHRLEGFINGSISPPAPFLDQEKQVSNPLFSVWIQYDSLVKSSIYGSVTQGMNAILLGHISARSQWLALEERFTNSTQSRVMELRGKLQTLKKENLSVAEYLLRAKNISDHLTAAGEIVPEKELVLFILNGLGPRYLSFVTTFNMTQLRPSVGVLHNQLEIYERMLTASDNFDQDLVMQANAAHFQKFNNSRFSGNNKHFSSPTSSGGIKPQSWNFHTFLKQQNQIDFNKNSSSNKNFKKVFTDRPVCQICDKVGHVAASCFVLRDALQGRSHSKFAPSAMNAVASASNPDSLSSEAWLLDSGASHHLTSVESQVQNNTPYQGREACKFESKWKNISRKLPRKKKNDDMLKQEDESSFALLRHRQAALNRVKDSFDCSPLEIDWHLDPS